MTADLPDPLPGTAAAGPPGGVPAEGRVVLLLTSPRVAAGLLPWPAWQHLRGARSVLGADVDPAWLDALAEGGVAVHDVAPLSVGQRAGRLVEEASGGAEVVWLGSPDGDPGLTDALAEHLSRRSLTGHPPEVEVVTGAYDVPGARLLDVVAVMDTLRSPGGCPWDAEQTHESLLPYLLEETHEVIEAVENGDREHLREELGDLLLQVVFHARIAEEPAAAGFGIDDIAAGIVAKLVRRHPHVFAGGDAATAADVERNWETLKAEEKGRDGVFEGIPATLPALARAQKMVSRLDRSGADVPGLLAAVTAEDPVGAVLLDAVRDARAAGLDAETVLRVALARLADAARRS